MPKDTFFNLPPVKRERILELAIEEFAANDYAQASISRLVAQAGIAKGSFYQYFEDKQDLYFYLLDLSGQEKLAFLREQEPPDPRMGLFPYLRWLFSASLQFQLSRPGLNQVAYRALYGNAPFRSEILDRLKTQAFEYYRQLISMGQANGDVNPEIDLDMAAFVLGSVINEFGNYLISKLGVDVEDLFKGQRSQLASREAEVLLDELIYLLQHGIGNPQAVKRTTRKTGAQS